MQSYKKILSGLTALLVVNTTAFTTMNVINNDANHLSSLRNLSEEELKQDMLARIEAEKIYLGRQKFIEYKSQKFASENLFLEYLLSNSILSSQLTASDPYKIIKEYESMTLDERQIYDVDYQKFVTVYRDAYGNIAPTLNEALDTYANLGLVKEQYSYDNEAWFDSPEEAKINQKNDMEISKSLYYYKNGNYYNAFNIKDIDRLLNTFSEGYYVEQTKNLNGENIIPYIKYGDSQLLRSQMHYQLEKDFSENYFYKTSSLQTKTKRLFTISNNNALRIDFNDGNKQQEYKVDGTTVQIQFDRKFNSDAEFDNWFNEISLWSRASEGTPGIGRFYYYRTFRIYDNVSNQYRNAVIKLVPNKWSGGFGKTPAPDPNKYKRVDQSTGVITNYADATKKQLITTLNVSNPIYSLKQVTREQKLDVYNAWYDNYFDNVIKNFGGNNQLNSFQNIKDKDYIKNKAGFVYKDFSYDVNHSKGTAYSVIESQREYESVVKEELLKNPVVGEDGENLYALKPNFLASREQLDNFLYLSGTWDLKVKYAYGSGQDVSSIDGKKLANSYQEAKELMFINQNPSLRKKFIVRDVFGKNVTEAYTAQEAVDKLQNKVKLEARMVNKVEYDTWDWNYKKSFDSIISSGVFNIWKVLYETESSSYSLYYPTQIAAINAILKETNNSSANYFSEKYLFKYKDEYDSQEYSAIFYDDKYETAIATIIEQITASQTKSQNKAMFQA